MFKIKEGVIINGIKPEMMLVITIAQEFYKDLKIDCVITSCCDGKHSSTSLHYVGYALDFRTRNMNNFQQKLLLESLKNQLTKEYDIILESNHLHVEFQPKR